MASLFEPVTLGALALKNRIVLSPLTRSRASAGRVPNDLMREYYVQRSSAGLIITEATAISPQGVGYIDTPGLWSDEQVAGWKSITEAVHAAGGLIVAQLWHVGRVSHPDYLDGELPVSSSAVGMGGDVSVPGGLRKPRVAPRALEASEIPGVIADYKKAAENAKLAGFDGVEIHGANGYLPEQFLRTGTNLRTDEWGGSLENRARFLLEATDAAIDVWGADRVGVHLSPRSHAGSEDSDPQATYNYVAAELGKRGISFLFTREALDGEPRLTEGIKAAFGGPVIANEGLTLESAQGLLDSGQADAVSWGRLFLANPDLPARLAQSGPYNTPNPQTFYAPGATGYTDYPTLDQVHSV